MNFSAVIVAAGSGTRAGAGVAKQWRRLAGRAVLRWSAHALLEAGAKRLVVVIRPGDEAVAQDALKDLERWTTAYGGVKWCMTLRQAPTTDGLPFLMASYGKHLDAAIDAAMQATPEAGE